MSEVMERTAYVDFHQVPAHQQEIDARLCNWGRWSINRGFRADCSPMFALYRSADPLRQYAANTSEAVDRIDAQRIQKAVTGLPGPHRLAISWYYIKRNNPKKAAQLVGHSIEGLARLVVDGRQMLMNRHA